MLTNLEQKNVNVSSKMGEEAYITTVYSSVVILLVTVLYIPFKQCSVGVSGNL